MHWRISALLKPTSLAALFAASVIILSTAILEPIWNLHDDSYYSMISGGFGIVDAPSVEVPFMHPLVGYLLFGLNSIFGVWAYSLALFALLGISLFVLLRHALQANVDYRSVAVISICVVPLLISPQYTMVSAWLTVCGLVELRFALRCESGCRRRKIHLLFAVLWLSGSMLLRRDMTYFAIAVCFPLILWSEMRKREFRYWAILLASFCLMILVYSLTEYLLLAGEMREFLRLHAQRVPFLDYGVAKLAMREGLPLGVEPAYFRLWATWFFADQSLFSESQQIEVLTRYSLQTRLLSGVEKFWQQMGGLSLFVYTQIGAALLVAVPFLRIVPRPQIFAALSNFTAAIVVFALLGRVVPDRVGLGLMLGMLATVLLIEGERSQSAKFASSLAKNRSSMILLTIAAVALTFCVFTVDRRNQHSMQAYDRPLWDLLGLSSNDVVYFSPGGLRLKSIFKPLRPSGAGSENLPRLISVATIYNHPLTGRREATVPCGKFVQCLLDGHAIRLFSPPSTIKLMQDVFQSKYCVYLKIDEYRNIHGNHFHRLRAEKTDCKNSLGSEAKLK